MKIHGIEIEISNIPSLDPLFIPLGKWNDAFLQTATQPLAIAIERNNEQISSIETHIHGSPEMFEADCFYTERLLKFLLWAKGGFKIYICGNKRLFEHIRLEYSLDGKRSFDVNFMTKIYESDFQVLYREYGDRPASNEVSKPIGRHTNGYRIGFDAGGSDRKVSAVIDGNVIYSEEVVWHPKLQSDPAYHENEILEAFKTAASKLPRVDAIGISSAGVYVNNRAMAASLFIKVPEPLFSEKVKDIYIRTAAQISPDIPVVVANDGDVTALAGAIELNDTNILGIAMGTSEAAGFIDTLGNITGWLNELAFAPVAASPTPPTDDWSGDAGCGVSYFSQDSVIRLAPAAGITISPSLSPAQKLTEIQNLLASGTPGAIHIFQTIGTYLGHTINLYSQFYEIRHILLLGRVMSGEGGNIILTEAKKVLADEYPALNNRIQLHLPEEQDRRTGQSVAAASLPEVKQVKL